MVLPNVHFAYMSHQHHSPHPSSSPPPSSSSSLINEFVCVCGACMRINIFLKYFHQQLTQMKRSFDEDINVTERQKSVKCLSMTVVVFDSIVAFITHDDVDRRRR